MYIFKGCIELPLTAFVNSENLAPPLICNSPERAGPVPCLPRQHSGADPGDRVGVIPSETPVGELTPVVGKAAYRVMCMGQLALPSPAAALGRVSPAPKQSRTEPGLGGVGELTQP